MTLNRLWMLGPILLAACNEYDLKPHNEAGLPPENDIMFDTAIEVECPTFDLGEYSVDLTPDCSEEPIIGAFDPIVEWTWNDNPVDAEYNVVESPPIVINLNDDNGDGQINEDDIPDIIFPAFKGGKYKKSGYLMALSGASQAPLFVAESSDFPFWGTAGVAAGDIDRDGRPDIFAPTELGVMRLDNEGNMVWHVELPTEGGGESIVSLGDLDADGTAEVIFRGAVIDANGNILWEAPDIATSGRRYCSAFAADLDQDGLQEVITSGTVFEHDGTVRWEIPDLVGYPALGDLDGDGHPEIISTFSGVTTVLDMHGQLIWTVSNGTRSGPPTVADFDGDGFAEVGIASKLEYTVYDSDGSVLWAQPTQETSSGMTGSAVFDFEGDGAAEVVYSDEETLWVYDGATGTVELEWTGHDSGTRYEYPTIVDIDQDGSAEILLPGGRGADFGLSVIGSADSSWVSARSIWNQYAYSITNVNDDGTIPAQPEANWLSWNSFRAGNSETKTGLELPDLQLGQPEICLDECGQGVVELYIPVENASVQSVFETLTVQVYVRNVEVHYENILSMTPGEVTWVGPISLTEEEYEGGVSVFVDTDNQVRECREDNNLLTLDAFPCD